jgi:acyl-CoA dehydrogenase
VRRTIYGEDHEAFRVMIREFLEKEVVPVYPEWLEAGIVPKEFFKKLGSIGVIGMNMPLEYGGGAQRDFAFNAILQEEAARALVMLGTLRVHMEVCLPYFMRYANDEQKSRWFPKLVSGEALSALALTEPDTGSDLAGVRTSAVREGEHFILNGSKTFITGGGLADLVIVLARTSADTAERREGLSLLVVEDGTAGFEKGRFLSKIGLRVQDTVELSFNDVHVPVSNLLGEEGRGFFQLGHNLPQERLAIAVGAVAQARAALEVTIEYVKNRVIFGQPVSHFQNTKFELAAVAAEIEAAECMIDRAIAELSEGVLSPVDAAKTKLFCTELQSRVVDRCLQLFGGYGYINDFPIARMYADARVSRIYGGTSEVMKSIISKSLGL